MSLIPSQSDLVYRVDIVNGRKIEKWCWNGMLHSINDNPSMIVNDGDELFWHTHGQLHRSCNPAIINKIGKQVWYKHDLVHRTNGPAKIYPDGTIEFWLAGTKYLSIQEWLRHTPCDTEELVMLKLKYG